MKIKQMEFQFKDGSSIYLDEDKARELYLKLKGLFGNYNELTKSYDDYVRKYEPKWVTDFPATPPIQQPYPDVQNFPYINRDPEGRPYLTKED